MVLKCAEFHPFIISGILMNSSFAIVDLIILIEETKSQKAELIQLIISMNLIVLSISRLIPILKSKHCNHFTLGSDLLTADLDFVSSTLHPIASKMSET